MFCPKCGEKNVNGAKFCAACGAGLVGRAPTVGSVAPAVPVAPPARKKRAGIVVAAVVAVLLVAAAAAAVLLLKPFGPRFGGSLTISGNIFGAETDPNWTLTWREGSASLSTNMGDFSGTVNSEDPFRPTSGDGAVYCVVNTTWNGQPLSDAYSAMSFRVPDGASEGNCVGRWGLAFGYAEDDSMNTIGLLIDLREDGTGFFRMLYDEPAMLDMGGQITFLSNDDFYDESANFTWERQDDGTIVLHTHFWNRESEVYLWFDL